MSVSGLNHFNITVPSVMVEDVRDFYVEVLGLRVGERPNFTQGGYWLYAGDDPIVHLVISEDGDQKVEGRDAGSYVDHIAFTCSDLSEVIGRLKLAGVEYELSEVPARNQIQIFLRYPAC